MAAYRDLAARAAALGAGMVYQGAPAGWLVRAARAAAGAPVVVNVKGIDADSTPVLVSLSELERLHRLAAQVDALLVLMPDKLGTADNLDYLGQGDNGQHNQTERNGGTGTGFDGATGTGD